MKHFRFALGLMAFCALAIGQYDVFMLAFTTGALTLKQGDMMGLYTIPCALGAITSNDDCSNKGGIAEAYWVNYNEIDWTSMAVDPLKFDPVTQTILGYTMLGGSVFEKLEFERTNSLYNFTFTEDADAYDQLVTMIFEGKSAAKALALRDAIGCCQIVLHIFDNNGLERVVGGEWTGSKFIKQLKTLRPVRHLDASGQPGQGRAREELDLGGQSVRAPLYAAVGASGIPV